MCGVINKMYIAERWTLNCIKTDLRIGFSQQMKGLHPVIVRAVRRLVVAIRIPLQ